MADDPDEQLKYPYMCGYKCAGLTKLHQEKCQSYMNTYDFEQACNDDTDCGLFLTNQWEISRGGIKNKLFESMKGSLFFDPTPQGQQDCFLKCGNQTPTCGMVTNKHCPCFVNQGPHACPEACRSELNSLYGDNYYNQHCDYQHIYKICGKPVPPSGATCRPKSSSGTTTDTKENPQSENLNFVNPQSENLNFVNKKNYWEQIDGGKQLPAKTIVKVL